MNELPDLTHFSGAALLRLYGRLMAELRDRELIRTGNPPVGDYGELLVARAFGGAIQPFSTKGFDVLREEDPKRIQVKTSAVVVGGPALFSPVRGLGSDDEPGFDVAVFVVLDRDTFEVRHAWRLDHSKVAECASFSKHVNGWRPSASKIAAVADDVTAVVRQAQESL